MHIDAVWQFRQIQTPEDGHIGLKHVESEESGKEKKNCTQMDLVYIDCLICHETGYLNIELNLVPELHKPSVSQTAAPHQLPKIFHY
jgi:hypothetical protein